MLDDATARRFWAKVDRNGPTIRPELGPCWVWTGARFQKNHRRTYGTLGIRGKRRLAHRIAWELADGPVPAGLWVLHNCDNAACVRRSHLRLGTQADNMRDAVERHRMPEREHHHKAKLTEADVLDIRRRWDAGEDQPSLAGSFGVGRATINHIITGRTWRSLPATVTRRGASRSRTLTNAEVAEAVAEYRAGGVSQTALGRRLGVSHPTISRWVNDPRHAAL